MKRALARLALELFERACSRTGHAGGCVLGNNRVTSWLLSVGYFDRGRYLEDY